MKLVHHPLAILHRKSQDNFALIRFSNLLHIGSIKQRLFSGGVRQVLVTQTRGKR
jgi:hypothetical protein